MGGPAMRSSTSRASAGCARIAASSAARRVYISDVEPARHPARRRADLALCLRAHRLDRRLRSAGDAGRARGGRRARARGGHRSPDDRRRCAAGGALSRWPSDRARYAGEWVVAVVADIAARSPRTRARRSASNTRNFPSCSTARRPTHPAACRCIPTTAPTSCSTSASCGATSTATSPTRRTSSAYRVKWGRSATVPIETFGVVASWDPWREMLDVWASIQMPKYADQIARALRMPLNGVRVHQDVDVGGSYGVKRGIKHTVLAGYLSRRLGCPVKLIEDRLENMRGGDMHGPGARVRCRAGVRRCRPRARHAHARARQRRRLRRPLAAAARQADRRHRRPLPHQGRRLSRHRGHHPTRRRRRPCAASARRPPTMPSRPASTASPRRSGLDRLEVRRRNFIRADEFPYLIPSGTTYDSGDYHTVVAKTVAHAGWDGAARRARQAARQAAARRHRHCELPGAERRQLLLRAAAQPEEHHHHVDGILPHHGRRAGRHHAHHPHHVGRPGPRDAGGHRGRRGSRYRSRPHPRGARQLARKPARQQPRRQPHGDHAGRRRLPRRPQGARQAGRHRRPPVRRPGRRPALPQRRRRGSAAWPRARMDGPGPDRAPPLSPCCRPAWSPASPSATSCRCRPAAGCRRPTAASRCIRASPSSSTWCWSSIDPGDRQAARSTATSSATTAAPSSTPTSCSGMTLGGIAHGLGAALLEEFVVRRRGPAADAELHGLSAAVGPRGAGGRDRAPRDAIAAYGVRPEGFGGVRLPRRAGGHLGRHQRRRAAARHPLRVPADAHLRHRRRHRRGPSP